MVRQVRRSTKFGKTTLAARRCPGGVASLDTEVLVSALLSHHIRRYPPVSEACLESVARTAGVGIGTLYRHFPTREALFEAVYRREVQQLADLAERLKEDAEPVEALRQWMRSNVRFVATKKGMSAALALAAYKPSDLFSYSFDQLTRAVGGLLDRAIAAGEIREDISSEDLIRALVGMCYMHDQPGWQKSVLRLVDVFIDGLRNRHTTRRSKK